MWRKNIWDELKRMQEDMDNMFRMFSDTEGSGFSTPLLTENIPSSSMVESGYRTPLSDLSETEKEYIATFELPGFSKNDIDIHVNDEGLELKAEKKQEKKEEDKKKGIRRFARSYAGFYRFLPLPKNVDVKGIIAKHENGVLELRIPKKEIDKKKAKKIEVK